MLINKILAKYNYIIVRSVELNYLKYLLDVGFMPIIKISSYKNGIIAALLPLRTSKNISLSTISILNINDIKQLLWQFQMYKPRIYKHLVTNRDIIWDIHHIYINRDLL